MQKGQLGHGDKLQRDRPTVVSELSKYVSGEMNWNDWSRVSFVGYSNRTL